MSEFCSGFVSGGVYTPKEGESVTLYFASNTRTIFGSVRSDEEITFEKDFEEGAQFMYGEIISVFVKGEDVGKLEEV